VAKTEVFCAFIVVWLRQEAQVNVELPLPLASLAAAEVTHSRFLCISLCFKFVIINIIIIINVIIITIIIIFMIIILYYFFFFFNLIFAASHCMLHVLYLSVISAYI
jgi:hypothetical protein